MVLRILPSLTALILVALSGCGKDDRPQEPTLAVDREAMQFGGEFGEAVYIGTSKQESLLIENRGLEPLVLSEVLLNADGVFTLVMPDNQTSNVELKGGEHTFLTVYFAPLEAQTYAGTISIRSNAVNAADKIVQLSGTGVPAP